MANENVIITEELYSKIKATLKTIKVKSNDKDIVKEVEELLYEIGGEKNETTSSLAERIRQKMIEVKKIDADIHTDLYILYRKLVENKISEKEALEAFEMYDITYYPKHNSNQFLL